MARRATTGVMLAVLLVTAVLYTALGYPVFLLGPAGLIAAYTLGARWSRRRGLLGLALLDGAATVLGAVSSPGLDSLVLFVGLITAASVSATLFAAGRPLPGNTRPGWESCSRPARNSRGMR